jgi:UDP-N-acetylglucosamine--N-acetylmuramyl-(pentapeptide) pyrophosphoryl-undecaprenol N-acetylglucosamine transferase
MSAPSVLLAGGGTGGHVIPAIAAAEELVRQKASVRFVGTQGRLEAELVPKAGFEIDFIEVRPLVGGSVSKKALGVLCLPVSLLRALSLLRKIKPDVVMGVGGYVAGPVVLGARLLGIPTALLEQNAAVGLTNRLLSPWVKRAFVSYEETLSYFPEGRAVHTGNPVKASILAAAEAPKKTASDGRVHMLVMGGSQGSRAVDELIPAATAEAGIQDKVVVLHQCGKGNEETVRNAYRRAGIDAETVSFIEDTAAAFSKADFAVARSGATTVSELTVMGLPAVFLPYPHHKDRQQERNAAAMKASGAAVVLDEKTATTKDIADAVRKFVLDAEYREQASRAAAMLGRKDAARQIADELLRLAGGSK